MFTNFSQQEIKFFWPLTEQIELDLNYGPTHFYYKSQGTEPRFSYNFSLYDKNRERITETHSMTILGTIHEYKK